MAHLTAGGPRSGSEPGRGRRPLWGLAVILLLSAVALTTATRLSDGEECPEVSALELRSMAARSDRIVEGTVLGRLELEDGTTSSAGLDVRVDRQLFGTAPASRLALWQPLDVPSLDHGRYVFFMVTHRQTITEGAAVDGYDTSAAGAVLAVDGQRLRRVCRAGRGPGIERGLLTAVVG